MRYSEVAVIDKYGSVLILHPGVKVEAKPVVELRTKELLSYIPAFLSRPSRAFTGTCNLLSPN